VRNIPKKDFKVENLKEVFRNTLENYIESKSKEEQDKLKKKRMIIQAKVMYEDGTEGQKSKVCVYISIGTWVCRNGRS
jgi:hypothetical protein